MISDILPVRRSSSLYGEGTDDILLSDLDCSGMEDTLLDCPRLIQRARMCDHSEAAGVRCGGN